MKMWLMKAGCGQEVASYLTLCKCMDSVTCTLLQIKILIKHLLLIGSPGLAHRLGTTTRLSF